MSAILLFRGTTLISRLIRWQTRSVYSHAAIQLDEHYLIESKEGRGVQVAKIDWSKCDRFEVEGMTTDKWREAIAWCHTKIGQPYDYRAVARFVTRRKLTANNRWFCSELVFEALQRSGINILFRVSPSEVSPAMLRLSPLLKETPKP